MQGRALTRAGALIEILGLIRGANLSRGAKSRKYGTSKS